MFKKIILSLSLSTVLFGNIEIQNLYNTKEVELKKIDLYLLKMKNLIKLENDIKTLILNSFNSDENLLASLLSRNPDNLFISQLEINDTSTTSSADYTTFVQNLGYKSFFSNNNISKIQKTRFYINDSAPFIDYNNKGFEICNILGETNEVETPQFIIDYYMNHTANRNGTYFFNNYKDITSGPFIEKKICIFYLYPTTIKNEAKINYKLKELDIDTYYSNNCSETSMDNKTIIIKDGSELKVGICKNNNFNFLRYLGKIPNKLSPKVTLDGLAINKYKYPFEYLEDGVLDLTKYSNQFNYLNEENKPEYNVYYFNSNNITTPDFVSGQFQFNKSGFALNDHLLNAPLSSSLVKYPYKMYFEDFQESYYLRKPCTNYNLNQNCSIFLNNVVEYDSSNLDIGFEYVYNNLSISTPNTTPTDDKIKLLRNYNLFFNKKNSIEGIYYTNTAGTSSNNVYSGWKDRNSLTGYGTISNIYLLNFLK